MHPCPRTGGRRDRDGDRQNDDVEEKRLSTIAPPAPALRTLAPDQMRVDHATERLTLVGERSNHRNHPTNIGTNRQRLKLNPQSRLARSRSCSQRKRAYRSTNPRLRNGREGTTEATDDPDVILSISGRHPGSACPQTINPDDPSCTVTRRNCRGSRMPAVARSGSATLGRLIAMPPAQNTGCSKDSLTQDGLVI